MKKFVSMAMVAAMTTSMVPATAFAGIGDVEATAKIVDAWKMTEDFDGVVVGSSKSVPELQIKITDTNYKQTATEAYEAEITVTLDNAELDSSFGIDNIGVRLDEPGNDVATAEEAVATAEANLKAAQNAYEAAFNTAAVNATAAQAQVDKLNAELENLKKDADAKETAMNTAKKAAETTAATAKTEYENAKKAYEDGKYAVDKATLALTEATEALTKATEAKEAAYNEYLKDATKKDAYDAAVAAEAAATNAKADATTAKTNAEATYNVATLKSEMDAKKSAYDTALNADQAYTAAKTEYDTAAAAVTSKESEIKTAEQAVKDAVEGDSTLQAAEADVEAKLAALEEAEKALATAGGITIEPVEGFKGSRIATGVDEFTFKVVGKLSKDDVIYVDLNTVMDKTSVGKAATLDVESDDLNLNVQDLVYVSVEDYGIKATTKKLAKVAEDEEATLEKDLKIESTVGDFAKGQEIELKLNNGFEFNKNKFVGGADYSVKSVDEDKAVIVVERVTDEITIKADDMTIEATKAKSGAVATITVKAKDTKGVPGAFAATTKVEVMKVVDYTVMMTVDEDEDIPVIYAGTNVDNKGITDDSDHMSLEVTIEESFPGAWSMRKGFNLELPDGVYVTDVDVTETEGLLKNGGSQNTVDVEKAFYDAYQDGDHKGFEFEKRVFDDVNNKLEDDCATMTFQLELVADPTFSGDVDLKFTGDLVDEQEVTIAKFVPVATVEAEQNDLKIDYRYTKIPTAIKVKETEAGLWEEGAEFWVALEKGNYIEFEDDATFEVTGGLEIDDFTGKDRPNWDDDDVASLGFAVDEESDEAATVTIKDMSLFMQRNIPAGAYDLTAGSTVFKAYQTQKLYAPDCNNDGCDGTCSDKNNDCIIDDIADFSEVVKEAFVNIVTAGREQDDASFTTKVVVPIGESYIVAGEKQVALDVPAYVSTAGYTMLPVRAVATALGINNNNVIWNGETKTVTILYGQRIITMVAGQKTVNVNGSVIPASAAVEIVDGRTFLPMRDLATALGVTDITWDAATKTATLNGNI